MKKITKIKNAIKRKVNESRLRDKVSSILNDALPNILAELKKEEHPHDLPPVDQGLEELDVRKTHGDKRIENPATGNNIKLRTALKAKKGSAVYAKGKAMYNALKDKPTNERAYASTDGKPYFDYDPGEGKLTEAFKKGDKVKYLGHPAVITHVEDKMGKTYYSVSYNKGTGKTKARMILSTDGSITEAKKIKPHGLGYRMNVRRAKADFKKGENIAAVSKQGLGSFKIEDQNDFNKYHPLQWDFAYIVKEGKLNEDHFKKGQKVKYQLDRGSSKALRPSTGTISNVKKMGNYYQYTIQDGGPVPVWGAEIIGLAETKSAPAGHYFTKGGNVVKGRLSKSARSKGATKSDPKDKQRSKVPPATQRNESAKDKFGAPPMNKWWTGSKESLMSAIYHAQRQVPPSNKAAYEKNWKNIVKQLQKKFPAPTAIYRKRLDEAHPLNKVIGGYPVKYEGDPKNYRAIITEPMNDRQKEDMIKRAKKAGYIAKPNMGGGVTIFVKEGKLTEAEDYKYKKYVAKAFKDILDAQFDFRHAMGVKQLTNKDMKLKKKADAIYKAIIDLQKDMKSKGLTEVQAMNMDTVPYNTIMKMKPGSTIKMKDGKIRTKDKFGNWRADTDRNDIIANRDVIKHMKGMKGFNIGNGRVRIEGKAGRKI